LQDRLMAAFLIDSRLRRGCLEELSHFHQQFWASDDALAAHAAIEQHFDSWRARTEGLMGALEQKGACGRYGTLCEIGCGNGRVLDHLAGRVGGIGRFIGVDLSETQTALNRRRYPNPKLEFVCAEALGWIGRHA